MKRKIKKFNKIGKLVVTVASILAIPVFNVLAYPNGGGDKESEPGQEQAGQPNPEINMTPEERAKKEVEENFNRPDSECPAWTLKPGKTITLNKNHIEVMRSIQGTYFIPISLENCNLNVDMRRDFPFNSLNVTNWGQWQKYKPIEKFVEPGNTDPGLGVGRTLHFIEKNGEKTSINIFEVIEEDHDTLVFKGEKDGKVVAVKALCKSLRNRVCLDNSFENELNKNKYLIECIKKDQDNQNILIPDYIYETENWAIIVTPFSELGDIGKRKVICVKNYEDVKNMTFQLYNGVNYFHRNGIAHQDIKPNNILAFGTSESPVYKFFDYDRSQTGKEYTDAGEQIIRSESYYSHNDKANNFEEAKNHDIYSLGLTLQNILFKGEPHLPIFTCDKTDNDICKIFRETNPQFNGTDDQILGIKNLIGAMVNSQNNPPLTWEQAQKYLYT